MADTAALRHYCCCNCGNLLSRHDDLVAKDYLSYKGRAFLFSHVINVTHGGKVERQLVTGFYTVVDVYCSDCGKVLGWKYINAHRDSQKHKEGKTVLEKFMLSDPELNW
ncbi:hypothetical protein SLA2020_512730 [Shorea laevis]